MTPPLPDHAPGACTRPIGIAFVIDFLSMSDGTSGGTERQLSQTVRHLPPERFRSHVFCLQHYGRNACWEGLACHKKILNIYSLRSPTTFPRLLRFARFLRKNRIDIVHAFFLDSILFASLAARLAGVKTVLAGKRDVGFWHKPGLVFLLRILNHLVTRCVANCQAVKDAVAKCEGFPPTAIDVIYNGIDTTRLDRIAPEDLRALFPALSHKDMIVGIVANFDRHVKRVDLFLRAAAHALKVHPNVTFLVVGGGRLQGELEVLAASLQIRDKVIFTGPHDEPYSLIKSFDIGVLASDSEGLSNAILEYMAAAIPVVATAVGGNPELVQDGVNGYLVAPGNPEALGDAVIRLLADPGLRRRFGAAGRALVDSRFAWEKRIIEVENYYAGLVNTR